MNQMIFIEVLLQRKLSFIRLYTEEIWRDFWRTSKLFSLFKQVEVWVSCEAVCDIFVWFFCLIF